jgi:hypothetical protein
MDEMHVLAKRLAFLAAYFVVSFLILNLGFPLPVYIERFPGYSRSYIVSSFLLLPLAITVLTAVAFPFGMLGNRPLRVRLMRTTALQFVLVSAFAIACSGLGFGLSLGDSPFFGRLGFFFAEWEWLRFIFESALPLALWAGVLYFVATWPVGKRRHRSAGG